MPRKLPWIHGGSSSPAASSTPKPAKRPRLLTPDFAVEENTTGVSPRKARRQGRTPSTSPPPEPPKIEFMQEGLSADDIWIMVEDEFLETAKLFTQHLHHAEYQRLKRLTNLGKASAINDIAAPAAANATVEARAKTRREAMRKFSSELPSASRTRDGSDAEDEEPWMRDSQLAGLMNAPRESSALLTKVTKARSNTRAAAGYSKARARSPLPRTSSLETISRGGTSRKIQRPTSSDTDSDDLDAPVRRSSNPASSARSSGPVSPSRKSAHSSSAMRRHSSSMSRPPDRTSRPSATSSGNSSVSEIKSKSRATTRPDTNDSTVPFDAFDFPKRSTLSSATTARMVRRKAEKEKEEKEKRRRSIMLDEIPTFLV